MVILFLNPLFNSNIVREIPRFFNKSLKKAIIRNNNNINDSTGIYNRRRN